MSREWKAGPINGRYLHECNKATNRKKSINGAAAIRKPSTMAGKVIAFPPRPSA